MSEPEGTAADFAAMLAGAPASSAPAAPEQRVEEPQEPSKQEADAAFGKALFGPKPDPLAVTLGLVRRGPERQEQETPAQDEAPPDFDGGVREPAPGSSDPEAEHNEFVLALLRNTPSGGGQQW